ncbi:TIGR01457 family HAD-type hydrolase [Metabacillus litoralis]|uniref:Acid sugar phosphatase n=1 Tax=Metabacillus litoralis TaxID=152268 RepID=A0A5C6W2Q9_9BACI|nr:TIGR01457 family HAD-type hydrolase [Metabacillus litoralis]TXC91197.1 TIGR01457 family HAD-type hydrolase [Metabacillus litoralis]
MKTYKGYLIDLDGTMYRGSEQIEAASEFVTYLAKNNLPYLFVTNNSSQTPQQVAEKLNRFQISATKESVFTTSQATANYISEEKENATIYVIGEEGLKQALINNGHQLVDDHPDYVVIGIDREISYEKLSKACIAVRNGATFISTNGDIAIPTEKGLLPGNGALTSVISVSTNTSPIFIGKPERIIVEQALQQLGVAKQDTVMVGDNYATDIMAGINCGLDTLLVHTGVTTREHLVHYPIQPTYTVDSLTDYLKQL